MQMLSLGPGVDTLMQIKIGSARLRGMGLLGRLWRNAGGPPFCVHPHRLHGAVRNCGDPATASIDDIWCENGGCRGSGYALLNVRYARLCAWERASRVIRDRIEPAASPGMVGFVAESRTELSCGHATGSNTIPETVTVDGPPVAKGAATVSASTLALHLDCSRTYIAKLGAEGAIQRQSDAFPLDRSRVAYLR
jgi:hypothetical protein